MQYREYKANPVLARYIKCYWSLESSGNGNNVSRERIFPDACIELVFHFGDLFKKYTKNQSFEVQPKSFVHGQLKNFIEIEATGKTGIFSVRFQPHGLASFTNIDINDITKQNVSVSDIWGTEGREVEEKIMDVFHDKERISIIESFLFKKLRENQKDHRLIDYCISHILNKTGQVNIESLASTLNISRRKVERYFTRQVGLGPKLISRIIRFQKTLELIEQGNFSNFTMLSYNMGYYDQSHFIRDFKEFTGLKPKEYFSEDLNLVKFFSQ